MALQNGLKKIIMSPKQIFYLNRNEYFFNHPPEVIQALTAPSRIQNEDKRAPTHEKSDQAERIAEEFISHYARPSELETLRNALAEKYSVNTNLILLGHGAEDIFVKILSWFRKEMDSIVIEDFSWTNYLHIAEGFDYQVSTIPVQKTEYTFCFNQTAFYEKLTTLKSAIVFVTSPNNPTGHKVNLTDFHKLVSSFPQHIFILDSVYNEIIDKNYAPLFSLKNFILVGSFSKFFGMPGLRLGYAIGTLPTAFQLNLGLQPSTIYAALAALKHFSEYQNNRQFMLEFANSLLRKKFKYLKIYQSFAPFFLAKVINKEKKNFEFAEAQSGVIPKYIYRGEETYLRFGLGPKEICEKIEIYLNEIEN